MGWQGDFGSSQAHQLTLGGSQAGSFAAHPGGRGLQKPPLLLLLGSAHPQGYTVAELRFPGVCKTLGGPLDCSCWTPRVPGGACTMWGAPAPQAVHGGAGMAPAPLPPPLWLFMGREHPRCALIPYCLRRIVAKDSLEAFQQQAWLRLLASLTAPCSIIIQINLF